MILCPALGDMFARKKPTDENDLNQKLASLLLTHVPELRSEHPTVSFACACVIPDHTLAEDDLIIEAKYLRKGTPPSKATEGIAADLTKYPTKSFIIFVVYDPERQVRNDGVFRRDIERKGRNRVLIVR